MCRDNGVVDQDPYLWLEDITGDDDPFDLGGILSAIIGVLIVLPIAGFVLRRTGLSPERDDQAR